LQGDVWLYLTDNTNQLQPGPHRALGVVLVGLRIAKINECPVAHVFRHKPAEALYGLGDTLLIGRDDLAQILRVHAGGECCRTDKVTEHDRDLAALGGVLSLRLLSYGRFRGCRGNTGKPRNGREHLPPMPEQNADVFEVLIGQMGEY
jgi:hypothetical protein